MAHEFKTGSLVWARMKGFAPWPGRVVDAPEECKKPKKSQGPLHCIFFFGSNNYAWIEEKNIKDYQKFKGSLATPKAGVKEAMAAIEAYIKTGTESIDDDKKVEEDFEKLRSEPDEVTTPQPAKPKKERKRKKTIETPSSSSLSSSKKNRLSERRTPSPALDMLPQSASGSPITSLANGPDSAVAVYMRKNARQVVESPMIPLVTREEVDLGRILHLCKSDIQASTKTFGFLGLGTMGQGIVMNLLKTGHKVHIWNRTPVECEKYVELGAITEMTPADVVEHSDITFCCVTDPAASRQLIFGNCGVLSTIHGKGFVEMTSIDDKTSIEYAETFATSGGRFLEAQLQGSKLQAEAGQLVILAAGDRTLFDDCQSPFDSIGASSFFLGNAGTAAKLSLTLTTISTICVVGLAEGMSLANATGVRLNDFIEIFSTLQFASDFLVKKASLIADGSFPTHKSVALCQKDLQLVLDMASRQHLPLHMTATANELMKTAQRHGLRGHDESAIYLKLRH